MYDRVKESGRLSALNLQAFGERVFGLLVEARHYQRVVDEYDVVARVDKEFETYETSMAAYEDFDAILAAAGDSISDRMRDEFAKISADKDMQERLRQSQRYLLRRGVAAAYEVLIGTGMSTRPPSSLSAWWGASTTPIRAMSWPGPATAPGHRSRPTSHRPARHSR